MSSDKKLVQFAETIHEKLPDPNIAMSLAGEVATKILYFTDGKKSNAFEVPEGGETALWIGKMLSDKGERNRSIYSDSHVLGMIAQAPEGSVYIFAPEMSRLINGGTSMDDYMTVDQQRKHLKKLQSKTAHKDKDIRFVEISEIPLNQNLFQKLNASYGTTMAKSREDLSEDEKQELDQINLDVLDAIGNSQEIADLEKCFEGNFEKGPDGLPLISENPDAFEIARYLYFACEKDEKLMRVFAGMAPEDPSAKARAILYPTTRYYGMIEVATKLADAMNINNQFLVHSGAQRQKVFDLPVVNLITKQDYFPQLTQLKDRLAGKHYQATYLVQTKNDYRLILKNRERGQMLSIFLGTLATLGLLGIVVFEGGRRFEKAKTQKEFLEAIDAALKDTNFYTEKPGWNLDSGAVSVERMARNMSHSILSIVTEGSQQPSDEMVASVLQYLIDEFKKRGQVDTTNYDFLSHLAYKYTIRFPTQILLNSKIDDTENIKPYRSLLRAIQNNPVASDDFEYKAPFGFDYGIPGTPYERIGKFDTNFLDYEFIQVDGKIYAAFYEFDEKETQVLSAEKTKDAIELLKEHVRHFEAVRLFEKTSKARGIHNTDYPAGDLMTQEFTDEEVNVHNGFSVGTYTVAPIVYQDPCSEGPDIEIATKRIGDENILLGRYTGTELWSAKIAYPIHMYGEYGWCDIPIYPESPSSD